MNDHPNVERIYRGYQAFADADMEAIKDLFADDAVWHAPGRNPLAGDFHGWEAIVAHFLDLYMATDGTIDVQIVAAFADDRFAVAVTHMTAQRNGQKRDRHDVLVYALRDGKVKEAWSYVEDPYELDDFLS